MTPTLPSKPDSPFHERKGADERIELAREHFLAVWGSHGVACGLGATSEGTPTLEARVVNPALDVACLPACFDGVVVHALATVEGLQGARW